MKRRRVPSSSALRSPFSIATSSLSNLCFLVLVLLLPTSSSSQRALPSLPSGELSEPQLYIASSAPLASSSSPRSSPAPSSPRSSPAPSSRSSPASSPAAASSASSPASSSTSVSSFFVRPGSTQPEAGEQGDRREADGARGGSPSLETLRDGQFPVAVSSLPLLTLTEQPLPFLMARSPRLLRQARPETEEHEKGEHEERSASSDGIFLPSFGADISPSHLQIHTLSSREGDGETEGQALLSTRLYAAGSIFACALAGAIPPLLFLRKEEQRRLQGPLRPANQLTSEGITPLTAKYIRLVMSFTGGVLLSVGLLHLLPSSQRQIASELSRQERQAARGRGDEERAVSPRADSQVRVGRPPVSAGRERSADERAARSERQAAAESQKRQAEDDGREPQGRRKTSFPRESGENETHRDSGEGDEHAPAAGETGKTFPYASVCCLLGVLLVMVLEALAEGEHSHEVHSHIHTHEQVRTHLHTEKEELEAEEEEVARRTGAYEPPALTAETPETERGKTASYCEGADGEAGVRCHVHGQERNRERETESKRETNSSVCRGDKPGEEGHADLTSLSSRCASSCSASSHESLSSSASLCSCFLPADGDREVVESLIHPPVAGLSKCVVPPPASAPPAFPLSHTCLSQSPPESEASSLCRGLPATTRALGSFFRRSNSCRESRRAATQTTRQRWLNRPSSLRRMYTAGCAVTAAAELSCAASSPCWCDAEKNEEERLAFPCRREVAAESEGVFLPPTQCEDDAGGFAATEGARSCGDKPKKRRRGDEERDEGEARWCCDGDFGPAEGSRSEETGGPRFRQASCCSQVCAFAEASCCSQLWPPHGSRSTSLSQRRVCRNAGESFDLERGTSSSRRDGDVGEDERRRDCGEDAPPSASCSPIVEDTENSRDSRGSGDACASHGHWTQHSRQRGGPAVEYSRSADHLAMARESGTSRFHCLDTHTHATWKNSCCRQTADAKERSRESSPRGAAFLAAASSPSLFGSGDGTMWRSSETRRHRFPKSACKRAVFPLSLASPLLAHATPPVFLPSSHLSHCECGPLSPRSDACTSAAGGFGDSVQRQTHRWKAANDAARSDGCRPLRSSSCSREAGTLCRQGPERVSAAGLTNPGDSDRANRRGGRMRSRCIYTVRNRCRKLCNRRHRVASSCGRCSSGNEGTRLLPPYGSSNTSATLADELRHEGDKTGAKELLVSGVLMLALSFHSLMEGVTLGTAPRPQLVAFAVLVHKGLESFALGSSLMQAQTHSKTFVWQMLLFALMTPAGVLLGIATTWLTLAGRESAAGSASSVSPPHFLLPGGLSSFLPLLPGLLTGVGSGTFLHVSLLECIAPQLMRCRAEGKASLLSVIAAVCLGATLMVFLA